MTSNPEIIEQLAQGGRRLADDPRHLIEAGLLFLAADRIGELHARLVLVNRPLSNEITVTDDAADECAVGGPHKKSADPVSFNCIKCGEPAFRKGHAMEPTQRKPRPPAAGPRHKFGDAGTCVAVHGTDGVVCGKAKGRAGRPPAEPAITRSASEGLPGVVPPGYRAPLGAAAADKFEGGGLGSSGVRR
jgi:hypothetical protein